MSSHEQTRLVLPCKPNQTKPNRRREDTYLRNPHDFTACVYGHDKNNSQQAAAPLYKASASRPGLAISPSPQHLTHGSQIHPPIRAFTRIHPLHLASSISPRHGRVVGVPVAVAGAPRRARQGGRVRARAGAGLPHPPQLLRHLLQGRPAQQLPQLPPHALHERQARAGAALRRPRRHRRTLAFAVVDAVARRVVVAPQGCPRGLKWPRILGS